VGWIVDFNVPSSAETAGGVAVADNESPAGWTSAAIAVHSILQIPVPMFLRLQPEGYGPIIIDFRHHAFAWGTSLSSFPSNPATVYVETEPTTYEEPPLFLLPGTDLDRLLWVMGIHSFQDERAFWLRPNDSFRLLRWPDLAGLEHTVDQMQMIALLGNVALTVDELAATAGVPVAQAQRLVNALSLMGVLESAVESRIAAHAQPAAATSTHRSLFSRLREKLGI